MKPVLRYQSSIAIPPQLQAKTRHPNPPDGKAEPGVPSGEPVRREAAINHRLVAQKAEHPADTGAMWTYMDFIYSLG